MKTPQIKIYDELVYLHPHRGKDAGDYWDLAKEMLDDLKHPAWRFISDGLRKKLNP